MKRLCALMMAVGMVALASVMDTLASSSYSCSCAVWCNGLIPGPVGQSGVYQAISDGAALSMCFADAADVCMKTRTGIVTEHLRGSCH